MEKSIITFSANEQNLQKTGGIGCYASDTVSYIEAHFALGDNWAGYDSIRAVWFNDYKTISTVLDPNGVCIVPHEVLTSRGKVMVNLVGSVLVSDELKDRLTTFPCEALKVSAKAKISGSETAEVTPSQFEQFVEAVKDNADRAEAGAGEAKDEADRAESEAESALASAQASEASALRASGYAQNAQSAETSARAYAQNAQNYATDAENAKDDAIDARDEIRSMRANAETLEPNQSATASYSNGVLTLGIPKGQKGDKGATGNGIESAVLNANYTLTLTFTDGTSYTTPSIRGATGATGATGNGISSVTLTSTSGAVKTYTIAFTDGTNTTFDVTDGEVTRAVLDEEITALKSDIDALENGSINYTEGYGITTNGTVVATEGVCLSDYIPAEGSTAYVTASSALTPSHRSNLNIIEYSEDKAFVDYWGANPTKSFTTSARTRYIRFSFDDGFEATVTKYVTSEIIYEATQTESLNERIDSRAETVVQTTDWDNAIPSSRHDPNTNYIDPDKVTSGYINASGIYTPFETLKCTDYIPLEAGKTYYKGIGVYGGTYYGYYDEDYNVVASGSTLGDLATSFVVPNNAKFGRFTLGNGAVSDDMVWIFTQNGAPEHYRTEYYFGEKMNDAVRTAIENDVNPTEYKGADIQAFDTCVCIGDSLTEGIFNYNNGGTTGYASIPEVSYPAALERITGINVTNLGVSGYTSLEWYTANQSADLSGHKMAIVQFGVNDVIEYGGWTQNSVDGYTGIINKLKADNSNIKIFISTVMPAISYPASNYTAFNTALKAFVENLEDADVILLDMATYGNTAPAQYNAGHLSAYGYWRLAKDYANYISWYMHNNGMQFQEIQFIGTDKHYT